MSKIIYEFQKKKHISYYVLNRMDIFKVMLFKFYSIKINLFLATLLWPWFFGK